MKNTIFNKYWWKCIFNMECWFPNYRTSEVFTQLLNEAIDKKIPFVLEDKSVFSHKPYYASINGWKLWVENHPYASFRFEDEIDDDRFMPNRRTVFRAKDWLDECIRKKNPSDEERLSRG